MRLNEPTPASRRNNVTKEPRGPVRMRLNEPTPTSRSNVPTPTSAEGSNESQRPTLQGPTPTPPSSGLNELQRPTLQRPTPTGLNDFQRPTLQRATPVSSGEHQQPAQITQDEIPESADAYWTDDGRRRISRLRSRMSATCRPGTRVMDDKLGDRRKYKRSKKRPVSNTLNRGSVPERARSKKRPASDTSNRGSVPERAMHGESPQWAD